MFTDAAWWNSHPVLAITIVKTRHATVNRGAVLSKCNNRKLFKIELDIVFFHIMKHERYELLNMIIVNERNMLITELLPQGVPKGGLEINRFPNRRE